MGVVGVVVIEESSPMLVHDELVAELGMWVERREWFSNWVVSAVMDG